MPYIKPEARDELSQVQHLRTPDTPGELNYKITILITEYTKKKGLNYQTINDVLGALDGASKEFYRRVAAPYEDKKIIENGDVYND